MGNLQINTQNSQDQNDLDLLISVCNFPEHLISLFAPFTSFDYLFESLRTPGTFKKDIKTREVSGNFLIKQC